MNYSAFYDDVLMDAPRCPVNVALNAIRQAVIEMCNKSRIWSYTTADVPVVASQAEYTITPPTDAEVAALTGAYFNDDFIDAVDQNYLDQLYGKWQTQQGNPCFTTQYMTGKAYIVPYPTIVQATDVLRWRVALRPTQASTSFDASGIFATDFYQEILSGAKYRLYSSPGKPFSNEKEADRQGRLWLAGINRARIQAMRSRGDLSPRIVIPRTV